MSDKIEKYVAWLGGIAIVVLLFIVTRNTYLNTDEAVLSLMGQDIAFGNLLLTDWVASTIPCYFPYSVMEGFWAIFFSHDLRTVHALTIVSFTIIFFALIWIIVRALLDKEKVKGIVITFVVLSVAAIFINTNSIDNLTLLDGSTAYINATGKDGKNGISDLYHHLSVILLMLPVIYLYYLRKQFDLFSKIAIVVLLLCHGSQYNYLYFVIPFIVENIFYFLKCKQFDKRFSWVIFGLFVSYLFRLVLTSSELTLSLPAGVGVFQYSTFYQHIAQHFSENFFYLTVPFSAAPWGQEFIVALPQFIFLGIFLVALYSFFTELKRVSRLSCIKLPEDRFIAFLLISAIFIFLFQIFIDTGMAPRRLVGSVASLYILLIYFVCKTSLAKQTVNAMGIFVIVFILSITNLYMQNRFNVSLSLKERMELVKLIERENLHYGYAWFGNASATNYVANRQIIADISNYFHPDLEEASAPVRFWLLDKTIFTRRPVDFIVIWKGKRGRWQWQSEMESPEMVKEDFGDPAKILETENLWLYIYSYDLYERMQGKTDFPPRLVRKVPIKMSEKDNL